MTDKKKLLEQRNAAKRKKPKFLRQCKYLKLKLKGKWRSARGLQSKMRKKLKGHRKTPSMGYGSPAPVKGLSRTGYRPVLVENPSQLAKIDKNIEAVLISSAGARKKVEIIKKAVSMGLQILNLKNPAEYLSRIEESLRHKKAEKEIKKTEKEKKKKELEKKAEEKKKKESETIEETLTEEEKKKQQKKEMDKALTHTQ